MPLDINGNWVDLSDELMPDFYGVRLEKEATPTDSTSASTAPAPAPETVPEAKGKRFCVPPFGIRIMKL